MRRIVLLLLLMSMAVTLGGCWDRREIDELGLVTAVGIDRAESPNRYSVTVQIANISEAGANEGQTGKTASPWVGTAEGESIFDAVRNFVAISSRRLMWAHNNIVVIGESQAREGIIPVIDFFTHNPELRMTASVVVAEGDAKKYIAAKAGLETPSGMSFYLLEGYRSLSAKSLESHMLEVSAALKNEYANPLISTVRLKPALTPGKESGGKEADAAETIEMSGAAVFKRDKLVGWLSPEEARGVAWLLNQTKNTVVTVAAPEYGYKSVSVETRAAKTRIKTEVVDGMPRFTVYITGKGGIVEEDGTTDLGIDEVKKRIAFLLNKRIEEEVRLGLETVQKKYMVDVLGFAAIVHAQNDQEWESGLKDRWPEVFPQIPVSISADIDIIDSTLNQEPMKVY
ncbi:MAG: Ger(x)C family spore germination protein [Firmicutes bacterium]|nr:Ger(x)C family spore germination protein [Bacillota bacterium]